MNDLWIRPVPGDQLGLAIAGFLDDCALGNLSDNTINWYSDSLERFHWWCHEFKQPTHLDGLDALVLRQFFVYVQNALPRWGSNHPQASLPASAGYVDRFYRALRRFFNWCVEQEYLDESPLVKVRRVHVPDEQPDPFSQDEIERITQVLRAQSGELGRRNRAIVAVLLDTGLRRQELASLTTDDVNLHTGEIFVRRGKGRKRRMVQLGRSARKALRHYWVQDRSHAEGFSYALFLARSGEALTGDGLRLMLARVGHKAQVGPVNPHRFRHTMAVEALRAGMPEIQLMMILGHTSLEMTRRYVKLAGQDLERAASQHSPLDRLKLGL